MSYYWSIKWKVMCEVVLPLPNAYNITYSQIEFSFSWLTWGDRFQSATV